MAELPERLRAFIAIRLSEAVELALVEFIESTRAPRDGIAWVRRKNLHVTIKFLGPAVDRATLAPLADALRPLASETAPFELRTRGVGVFPDLARPRVLWAGLESDALRALAARVESVAAGCGFPREARPFSGHLTIGRVRNSHAVRAIRAALDAAREHDFGVCAVNSMTLYRSTLAPEGSIYDVLESFPFAHA